MVLTGASREIEKGNYGRLRALILLCFAIFVTGGLVVEIFFPEVRNDNFFLRVFICVQLLAVWWATGRWKNLIHHFNKVVFLATIPSGLYLVWLAFINSWSPLYILCLLVHTFVVLSVIGGRHLSIAYAASVWTLSLIGFFVESPQFSPMLSTLCLMGSFVVALFANLSRDNLFSVLKASEETSYLLLSNIPEGVVLFDSEGRISLFNSHAPRILDLSYEFLAGRSYSQSSVNMYSENGEIIYPDEQPQAIASLKGEILRDIPVTIKRRDGAENWLSLTAIPLNIDQAKPPFPVLLSCRDITEAREAQKRLLEQQAVLASASKLTALGEMSAGIAHEINNPLAIISGRASQLLLLVQTNSLTPQNVMESARKIEDTVKRISRIITSMRSVARESSEDPFERTSVASIIEDALALCKESLNKSQVQLLVDYNPVCEIECRPGSIAQILMNLISNARDAVNENTVEGKEKWIRVSTVVDSQKAQIIVEDSGPGVPEALRSKIMQPFFTTKEVGKGTGLGLSISRGIANAHGGRLFLDEAPQTRFVLELPLRQSAKSAA